MQRKMRTITPIQVSGEPLRRNTFRLHSEGRVGRDSKCLIIPEQGTYNQYVQ